jgi:hypothetical protein
MNQYAATSSSARPAPTSRAGQTIVLVFGALIIAAMVVVPSWEEVKSRVQFTVRSRVTHQYLIRRRGTSSAWTCVGWACRSSA